MKLFYAPSSPFVRKVMVFLIESGQMQDVTLESVYGSPIDPGDMPVSENPLGKLPTLVREDGKPLYDSRVILRYLDHRAVAGLYPPEPALWDCLTLEATAEGVIEAALLIVYEGRLREERMRSAGIIEGQWQKISRALDLIEADWVDHLAGPLDAAQIGLGCALGYLDFRLADRDWRAGRPKITRWYEEFVQRESMQKTMPKDPA